MPLAISHFTVRDGWISALLFSISSLIVAATCALYLRAFPTTRLSEAIVTTFGPIVGHALGLWLAVWLWIHTALSLNQFMHFVATTVMPRTPLPVLEFALFFPITYAVFLGLEVIARFGEFIIPITIPVFGVLTGFMVLKMHIQALVPILADGWSPVLQASLQPDVSFALQLLLVLEILPELRDPETLSRDVLLVGAMVTISFVIIEIIAVATLGGAATYLQYPMLEVIRGIEAGRFIQRLDTIYVMGMVVVIMLKAATLQYMLHSSIRSVFKVPVSPILLMSGTALTGASGIYFWRNNFEFAHYSLFVSPAYFCATLLVLPLATVLVHRMGSWARDIRKARTQ